jgi:hypothetical protein
MNTANPRSHILIAIGYIAMLIGAIDPMEGSLVILPGSGLVLLGSYLGHNERRLIVYRLWMFMMIFIGVAALVVSSIVGGIGATTPYSMWWGVFIAPYLIGWSMTIWGPGSPTWVRVSGIALGLWYLVMMLLSYNRAGDFGDAAVSIKIFACFIGIIGAVTIAGCIYRLRSREA